MNRTFFFLLLLSTFCFGQERIDNVLSVTLPGQVMCKDTIVGKATVRACVSTSGADSYAVQRITLDAVPDKGKRQPNKAFLDEFYGGFVKGYTSPAKDVVLKLEASKTFTANGWLGQEVVVSVPNADNQKMAIRGLVLDGFLYTLTYYSDGQYDEQKKSAFFDSMKIQ